MAKKLLSREAARAYYDLSYHSYLLGIISDTHLLDRLIVLSLICEQDDPLKLQVADTVRNSDCTTEGNWIADVRESRAAEGRSNESIITEVDYDDGHPMLQFTPGALTGLTQWVFHQSDPDYFPSVPHGHYQGKKQPKLDAYLGWIYDGSRQTGREPRAKIIALWNDQKFRDFARTAINFYIASFPSYRGWRVPDPRVLPRRRP